MPYEKGTVLNRIHDFQCSMSLENYLKFLPSFFILIGIIALTLALRRLDIFWLSLGLVSFVLMIGVVKVEEAFRLKIELIAFLLIPLFLGMSGISGALENNLYGVDIAIVIFAPTLGFILMFNLHHHTSFRANFHFTLFFVMIFSLASGALIGIGGFLSDQHLGTTFLKSNYDLMIDLIFISIGSMIMGLFFRNYLRSSEYESIKSFSSQIEKFDSKETGMKAGAILFSGFGKKGHRWATFLSRILQLVIIIFAIYAIYEKNPRWFFSAILSFGATMIPHIFTRNLNVVIPPILNFWITAALFFHVLGGVMGYYDHVWWWDKFTHSLSAALISILGFTILLTINQLSDSIHISSSLIPLILLLFILSTGVAWEIFEFFSDQLLGTNMQYGLRDTVYDMMFNVLGAFVAAGIGYKYFPSKYWN